MFVIWSFQMTLQDMYVEDKHYEVHLWLAQVLLPSQCHCEVPHRVKDFGSEARICVRTRDSSNLEQGAHTMRQDLTPATHEIIEKTNNVEGVTPLDQKDDQNLPHLKFQESLRPSSEKINIQKSLIMVLRERRSIKDSDTLAVPLVINFYLNEIWPDSSCTVSSSLFINMRDIIEQLPDSFWGAGGTVEEQDVSLLAGAIFAGASKCLVQNVTAAQQTGHLASLMVASLRAATILNYHII